MKNKIIFYLFLLITLINCSKSIKVNSDSLPFNSDSLKRYYFYNKDCSCYKINTKNLNKKNFLNQNEKVEIKNFENYYIIGKNYYPVLSFTKNSYKYIGILYEGYVENDFNCLFFQLNSYDEKGNLIDALLLDNRFTFEISYWNNFTIRSDGYIDLIKYSHQLYDFSEENYNVKKNIESKKNMYKMNKGKFEKVE